MKLSANCSNLNTRCFFLIAYLLYNDGIQTVITSSSIFISQELFIAKGLEVDNTVLIIAFLIAQIVAFIGALVFERIAHFTDSKIAIIISLVIWSAIVHLRLRISLYIDAGLYYERLDRLLFWAARRHFRAPYFPK